MSTLARRGWLTTAAVLGAGLTLLAVAAAVMAVRAAHGEPVSFPIPAAATLGSAAAGVALPPGLTLAPGATVPASLADPSAAPSAWGTLLWLPSSLLGGAAVSLVLLAVVRARRGEPLSGRVVASMRALGVVLLVGGPLVQLLTGVGNYRLAGSALGAGPTSLPRSRSTGRSSACASSRWPRSFGTFSGSARSWTR